MSAETIQQGPQLSAAVALLGAANLPASDLTEQHLRHFFFCGTASAPTGLVGLEMCGNHALLRSLVVTSAARSKGLGCALMSRAEGYAREQGARSIYLLTTTAEAFFRRWGYLPASRDSAPAEIKATREFAHICPASSAFLAKTL